MEYSPKRFMLHFAICSLAFFLIMTLAFLPTPVSSAVVWSDDFDDGNYNGWTVRNGTFDCTDYTLAGIADSTPSGITYGMDNEIWINSTVSYGTWSFDLYYDGQSVFGPAFWFACDVVLEGDWVGFGWPGGRGLCVQRESNTALEENGWFLHWVNGDTGDNIAHWPAPNGLTGPGVLSHVRITYYEDEFEIVRFNLWINGTLIGQSVPNFEVESQNLLIVMNNGSWIDNIVVSDSYDPITTTTTTSTTTTTTTTTTATTTTTTTTTTSTTTTTTDAPPTIPMEYLLIGGGAAFVVIILVVYFLKR